MIIGLHGKMGAGKNEAARRLARLAPPVVEVSFAAKLKESAAMLFGVNVAYLEVWKNMPEKCVAVDTVIDGLGFVAHKTHVLTWREVLQRYGTEAHRDVFGSDFWLDAALPVGRDYSNALYVATDVRFPNEAQRIRDLGGLVVGIIGHETNTGEHRSEIPLNCDVWINNARRDDGFATLDTQLRSFVLPALAA